MEKLSLLNYLDLCLKFEQDPTEENENAIHAFLSQLQIKEYMPLKDKIVNIVNILRGISPEFDATGVASNLAIWKVTEGLFHYCLNLDNDAGIVGGTFPAYDAYWTHGLIKTIKKGCAEDYQEFCHMLQDSIDVSNITQLLQTASLINDGEYNKWIETMQELKNGLDPQMIKDLIAVGVKHDGVDKLNKDLSEITVESMNIEARNIEGKVQAIKESVNDQINRNK